MRIALASIDQSWLDKEKNFEKCEELALKSKALDSELVIFPELTLTGFCVDSDSAPEPRIASGTLASFKSLSYNTGVSIIFGALLRNPCSDKPHNSFCISTKQGEVKTIYSKIHTFSFADEDKYVNSGEDIASFVIDEFKFFPAICYDLRFPEIFSIASAHCNTAVVIANWPSKRIDHWNTLLKARAIENQIFAIGVNRTGLDNNGLTYVKSSAVYCPDGSQLKPIYSDKELDVFDLDLNLVWDYRDAFPTVRDKKFPLYRKFIDEAKC